MVNESHPADLKPPTGRKKVSPSRVGGTDGGGVKDIQDAPERHLKTDEIRSRGLRVSPVVEETAPVA